MIYRMTIDNFDLFFPRQIASRGRNYFRNSRVKTLEKRGDGKYHATVKGSLRKYDVLVDIEKSGTINDISCSCPYDYGYCKHEYAVLMCLENIFDNEIAELSSDSVYKLISEYSYKLESKNEMPVNIEPEIFLNNDKLSFRLRIGRDRKYLISDINKLVDAFKYNSIKKYGKNFEWKHDISAIDIKSRRLMELAFEIFRDSRSDYRNMNFNKEKEFWLKDSYLERFFEIFEYGQLNISGDTYTFSDKAPYIKASLKTSQNGRMKFSASECPLFLGSAEKGYFLSEEEHTIYIADGDYTRSVSPLLKALGSSGELFVSKNDIPAFYNTVIRQVDDYLDIDISSLDDDIIPPQLISQLYIDVDEDDVICAALQFSYGNVFYSALKRIPDYIYADKYGEENALSIVCRYFELDSTDDVHPFKISNDDDAFRLINEGVTLLSKNMELYVSDRFRAISIRRSVRTNVGIRPSGSLLEMDISATGYNMQELLYEYSIPRFQLYIGTHSGLGHS